MLLQPGDGLVVEVVGRLVEQQQFRLGGQGGGEGEPGAPAAGQGAEPTVGVEVGAFAEAAQGGRDPPAGVAAAACLVSGEEFPVGGELLGAGPVQEGFGGADTAFEGPQVGEREVDGLADAGVRGRSRVWARCPVPPGAVTVTSP